MRSRRSHGATSSARSAQLTVAVTRPQRRICCTRGLSPSEGIEGHLDRVLGAVALQEGEYLAAKKGAIHAEFPDIPVAQGRRELRREVAQEAAAPLPSCTLSGRFCTRSTCPLCAS